MSALEPHRWHLRRFWRWEHVGGLLYRAVCSYCPFHVGDRIVSTCGSLYRGYEGVITAIKQLDMPGDFTDVDGWHYSVTIFTEGAEHACGFKTSQMVLHERDPGRDKDVKCENCLGCTLPKRRKRRDGNWTR